MESLFFVRDGAHVAVSTVPFAVPLESEDIPFACGVVDGRAFALLALKVPPALRGRGLGSRLLRGLAAWCEEEEGCRRIDVDDMSDRARRADNIYVRHGFVYRAARGPEMYAHPRAVRESRRKK